MVKYFCTLFAFTSVITIHSTAPCDVGLTPESTDTPAWLNEEPPYIPTIEGLVAMAKILASAIEDGKYAPHIRDLRYLHTVLDRGIRTYYSHFNPELFLRYNTPCVLRIRAEMAAILAS